MQPSSPRGDAILNHKIGYTFGHTLTQGALWHGPIGRCTITLKLNKRPLAHYSVTSAGFRKAGRTLVYSYKDFVPRADLVVTVKDAP